MPEFHAKGSIVPDRVVVGFDQMPTDEGLAGFCASVGSVLYTIPDLSVCVVRLNESRDPQTTAAELAIRPGVRYAEPDTYVELAFIPDDPLWSSQWDKPMIGAPATWDLTMGDPASLVAFTDTGVNAAHEDLVGQFITGWNVPLKNTDTNDDYGHGTQVAGMTAAIANNGIGLAGLAPKNSYVMVKVLTNGSGTVTDVVAGITWAVDNGARVVSISLVGAQSTTMQSAVEYTRNNGALMCAAAGNGDNTVINYPAGYTHALSIAASSGSDGRGWHSTYGSWVSVAAPGQDVWTTERDGTYGTISGTSLATPLVAGEAGMIYSIIADPGVRTTALADEVRAIIEANVVPKTWVKNGRVDVAAAVTNSYVTVSGTVTLGQWVPGPAGVQMTLALRDPGTANVVQSSPITLDANGNYLARFTKAGTYDVVLSGGTWLNAGNPAQTLVRGANAQSFATRNGDVNRDNDVDLHDLVDVLRDWGNMGSDPADCDGDGTVGIGDVAAVLRNFWATGF